MMLNCDSRDRLEDQYLKLMIYSFLAHIWVLTLEFNQIYLNIFCIPSVILILTSLCDVLVTIRSATKLRDVHYNQC